MKEIMAPKRRGIVLFVILSLPFVVMGLSAGCISNEPMGNPPVEIFGFDLHPTKRNAATPKPETKIIYKAYEPKM